MQSRTYLIITLAKMASWLLCGLIVILSVVPPAFRPVSGASQGIEHAGIYLVTGLAFAIGYRIRTMVFLGVFLGLAIAFAASVEVLQAFVPGRHTRLSDFIVDAIAGCLGLALGMAGMRLSSGARIA